MTKHIFMLCILAVLALLYFPIIYGPVMLWFFIIKPFLGDNFKWNPRNSARLAERERVRQDRMDRFGRWD